MVFWRRRRRAVGVVLDSEEARAVELEGSPQSPELTAWGRIPLPKGSISDGDITDPQGVAQALTALWEKEDLAEDNVILGVSNQAVFVRFASFPKLPPGKLAGLLKYQAQEFFPFPLANAVMDYAVLEGVQEEDRSLQPLLIVAAPREMIDKHLLAFSLAGLHPRDVNIVALCLMRLLNPWEPEVCAVVEVGCGATNILIASGGVPRFLRFIPKGVGDAAKVLGYGITDLASVSAASGGGGLNEDLLPWGESLAQEVASSLSFYEGQGQGQGPVRQVFFCGRGACIPGLNSYLQEVVGLPVLVLRSFPDLRVSPGCASWKDQASVYAGSLALAWRGLEV